MVFGLVVAGVVVPVSTLFMRRSPADLGLHPDGAESAQAVVDAAGAQTRAARLSTTRNWTVREALRTPAMWLMLAADNGYAAAVKSVEMQEKRMSPPQIDLAKRFVVLWKEKMALAQ